MKLKSFIFIINAIIISIFNVTAVADPIVLFCPSPSQIIIKDIYSGTAQSADGKWSGVSAIPPEYKNNWQKQISNVSYSTGYSNNGVGNCQYQIGGVDAIDLTDPSFPTNYKLYNITMGVQPAYTCTDENPSQTPLQDPTDAHPCYYYKNSVL